MTFRTRILLACLAAAVLPLVILAAGARQVVRERLTEQYRERVAASRDVVRRSIAAEATLIDERLRTLERQLLDEPRWRSALLATEARADLLDFAPTAMATAGLDFLLLIADDGTILSSGHFRNDYGRPVPGLAERLRRTDGPSVAAARSATGGFLALVSSRTLRPAGRSLTLVAGVGIDSAFTARLAGSWSDALAVSLSHPGGRIGSSAHVTTTDASTGMVSDSVPIPFIDTDAPAASGDAQWEIVHSLAPLEGVTGGLDRWFGAAAAAALLFAFVIARVVAGRVTRPLEQLARNASRVELTRYDAQLALRRQDEIGSLSRLLDRMVQRLRAAAQQLRDAERRATVGDMARQVNHDIRNGLLPIRNVIRHLAEVAEESPAELGTVFRERSGTLQGGIGYLENLATNYARLTPRTERRPCDVNALLHDMRRDAAMPADDRVVLDLAPNLPHASADPIALRRVIENLVINALESLDGADGRVVVRTAAAADAAGSRIIMAVTDSGIGIPAADLDRVFDDFHTTKERGTGLGLSIVRRLVTDMGGRVTVESVRGSGTTFTIELPAETASG